MQTQENVSDPVQSAKDAGLRYVSDTKPGIVRKRFGKGFRYVDTDGKPVKDPETLARIKSLVIPSACPSAQGHLQVTGRDALREESKAGTIRGGVRSGTRQNMSACCCLDLRCRRFVNA